MPKDNLPEPQSEIAKILNATLKGEDLNSLPATCEISQYQKEIGKKYQEIIDGGGGGTPVSPKWGNITGNLSDQEDLKTALDTAETKATFSGIEGSLEDNTILKDKIDEIEESITQKAEVRYYTVDILADNWLSDEEFLQPTFYQNIDVTGILEADHPKVDIFFSDDPFVDIRSQLDAYSCLTKIVTTNDCITLFCLDKKPEVDFTIQMEVVS